MYSPKVGSVCTPAYLDKAACSCWVAGVFISGGSKLERKSSPCAAGDGCRAGVDQVAATSGGQHGGLEVHALLVEGGGQREDRAGLGIGHQPVDPGVLHGQGDRCTLVLPNGKLSLM